MSKDAIVTGGHNLPQAPRVLKMIFLMIPLVLPLGFALDLYLPSIPSMVKALDSTPLEIQLTLTLFMYCFGFGQLIVGPITDKFGRICVLKASWVCFIAGSALCTFSQSLIALLIGRALQAFGACGTQVVAFALVRDQYDGKSATLIYTTLKGAMAIAPIGAPILGAFLQVNFGWQANFAVLSLYGISALVLCTFALKESPGFLRQTASLNWSTYLNPYLTILSCREFLYFAICGLATQAAMFGYFSLSPQYFVKLHGLTELEFANLFSINAFIFLLTSLIGGKFVYKLGFKKCTLLGAALLFFSGSLMLMGDHHFNHPYVLFLPNLIASSAASMMLGAAASGAMMPFKQNAGSAAALFGCFEFIGGASIGQCAI
ncbi:MAG: multidrug effflux MFS transporter, partial [Proteobacteria bacterium]|nr:multidrug effflux MFS transporter [Pseudomonadota bacterium]